MVDQIFHWRGRHTSRWLEFTEADEITQNVVRNMKYLAIYISEEMVFLLLSQMYQTVVLSLISGLTSYLCIIKCKHKNKATVSLREG